MDAKQIMRDVKRRYGIKGSISPNTLECAELAFLAMLEQLFTHAPDTDGLFSRKELKILDAGCSTMPYAFPLYAFFERFRQKRRVNILGVDTGIATIFAQMDIKQRGIEDSVKIKTGNLSALSNGDFDVITCFNFQTLEPAAFLSKLSELLAKGGLLLLSFDMADDLSLHEREIKRAGFEIFYKEENQFTPFLSRFIFKHALLCLAKKKG